MRREFRIETSQTWFSMPRVYLMKETSGIPSNEAGYLINGLLINNGKLRQCAEVHYGGHHT
jgi:hypothetical protein